METFNTRKLNSLKNCLVLLIAMILISPMLNAQTDPTTNKRAYTRSSGYFIRPEVYGALGAEFGYQFSPYFQLSGGPAFETDFEYGGAYFEFLLGVRAYASETKWTAFFDYHASLLFIDGYALPIHRFAIGPSYKNLDLGVGIGYTSGYWAPIFTLGYHFRLNKNR